MPGVRFSESAARRTRRSVRRLDSIPQNAIPPATPFRSAWLGIYIVKTPVGGIPAKSGSTLGSASCTLRYINDSAEIVDWLDNASGTVSVTVYNMSIEAVEGEVDIQVQQELLSGKLLADWEDC